MAHSALHESRHLAVFLTHENRRHRNRVCRARRSGLLCGSNPEFLKEGEAVNDFLKPDRIIIGTDDDRAFELLSRLYSPYNRQRSRILRTSPTSTWLARVPTRSWSLLSGTSIAIRICLGLLG
jgi:UDP-glucose 6-dehydrogenase